MFFPAECPGWFWILPMLGMLFMIGIMFLIARAFMKSGSGVNCCGRRPKEGRES